LFKDLVFLLKSEVQSLAPFHLPFLQNLIGGLDLFLENVDSKVEVVIKFLEKTPDF
jgi:hypothetical protein